MKMTRLLICQNRGLTAAEKGEVFYSLSCKLLLQCENAKNVVKEVSGRKRLVRIGMAPMIAGIFILGRRRHELYLRLWKGIKDIRYAGTESAGRGDAESNAGR